LTSQISRISPAVDEWNRAILFEAIVDNENAQFRSGLFAVAEVEIDPDATALVVPQSAVWQFAGTEKVWRVDAGQARQRSVLTGRRRDNWVEILEGLSEGDWVVQDASVGRAGPVAPPGAMQASAEVTPNTLPIQSPQHGPEPEEKTPAGNTGG
jgi:membrane fusion protein (multidrug efflux system)